MTPARPFRLSGALCALLLLAAAPLAGCGFSPLYAEDGAIAQRLSGVRVETTEGREGYLVGQALRDRMGTWGDGRDRYLLRTRTDMSQTGTALTIDQVASRLLLTVTVAYGLYDLESGRLLTQGRAQGEATYDVPRQPYAAIRAEQDSVERAAQDAAVRINLALARYFHNADAAERRAAERAEEEAGFPDRLAEAGAAP